MKKTKAPKLTPSPKKTNSNAVEAKEANPGAIFISMALDMSWRLAIVVLVPVIGGALLGKHYKHQAIYLLAGFALALIGAIAVIYQSYKQANQLVNGRGSS